MNDKQTFLIGVLVVIFIAFLVVVNLLDNKSLNGIKAKKVGNGQHGTARWATKSEIKRTFIPLPFEPEMWRKGQNLPTVQGTVVGCQMHGKKTVALVDDGDVHTLMIGAAGVGKTAYFLYPNIELACASGMSFISTDTKGDVARNYGTIANKYYGYNVSVLDLRNPTRSDENNILHLVNKYMDIYLSDKNDLSTKAKAEKYAKITAKTIINIGGGDSHSYGQNDFSTTQRKACLPLLSCFWLSSAIKMNGISFPFLSLFRTCSQNISQTRKQNLKCISQSLWTSYRANTKPNGLPERLLMRLTSLCCR